MDELQLVAQVFVYFGLFEGPPPGNGATLLGLLLLIHVVALVAVHQVLHKWALAWKKE